VQHLQQGCEFFLTAMNKKTFSSSIPKTGHLQGFNSSSLLFPIEEERDLKAELMNA